MTDAPPRILVIHLGRRGAGPRFTLEIAKAVAKRGMACAVLLSARNLLMEEFRQLNVPLYIAEGDGLTLGTAFRVRQCFRRVLREWQPTEVWCGMGHPLDLCGLDLIRRAGVPYKLVVHDGDPHPGDPYSWLRRVNELEARWSDVVVTLSSHVSRSVRLRWPKKSVMELWHPAFGGDIGSVPAQVRPAPNAKRHLLFFGRIIKYKGLELLLDAALLLRARKVPFELTVVGEGPLSEAERKKIGAVEATLINRFVSEDEASACFRSCDVVVVPYIEASQSGVVASAIGHGKPVVATPVGGLADQVRSQAAGMVISEVSAPALADALERVCRDDPFLAAIISGAVSKRRDCDWSRWVEQLLTQMPSPSQV